MIEEAEKLVGRKLNPTEKYLIEHMYDHYYWSMDIDSKGDLILNRKE